METSHISQKKELQDLGLIMTQIEVHPEYTHLSQCKAESMNDKNEFMTKQQCAAMFSVKESTRGPGQAPKEAWYNWFKLCLGGRTGLGEFPPRKLASPARAKAPTGKLPRCKPKEKAKVKTPKAKLPRCKPETLRHPVLKTCQPYPFQ